MKIFSKKSNSQKGPGIVSQAAKIRSPAKFRRGREIS